MKKIQLFFLFFLLVLFSVNAQEFSNDPGVTPSSFWFSFDTLAEKIQLVFYQNAEDKVKLGLDMAYERLAELNYLLSKNDFDSIEKNKELYVEALDVIKDNIAGINNEDFEKELDEELKLKKWILEHHLYLETVRDNSSGLSESQIREKESLILFFDSELYGLEKDLEIKKHNTLIKISAVASVGGQDDVFKMVERKEGGLGITELQKSIINTRVIRSFRGAELLKDKSAISNLLKQVNSSDIEGSRKILDEVDTVVQSSD